MIPQVIKDCSYRSTFEKQEFQEERKTKIPEVKLEQDNFNITLKYIINKIKQE